MPSDCLAITGSSEFAWIIGGVLFLAAGVVLVRWSRVVSAFVLPCIFLAALTTADSVQRSADAQCSPAPSSILQGQLRIVGGVVTSNELPDVVASNGTTSVTATWGTPESSGSDVIVAFAFPNLSPGDWSIDVTESPLTSFEFASSDLSLVVNSSRMLTGGPFNASTSTPINVPASGLTFEIAVTQSS